MKLRPMVLATLVALAATGGVFADVAKAPDLTATGRIVSKGNISIVLETDDHGHSIAFIVGTTTEVPPVLAVGSRVTVHYHPVGTDQQMADRIVILDDADTTSLAGATGRPQASASPTTQAPAEPPAPDAPEEYAESAELPRTASPIPLVGLLGLGALLASAGLRALERAGREG